MTAAKNDRRGLHQILRENAGRRDFLVAMIIPRSRLGGFRRPQFVAAKRKPRGRALSGAVFIGTASSVRTRPHLLGPFPQPAKPLHSVRARAAPGDRLSNARRRRSSGNVAARQSGHPASVPAQIGLKERRKALELCQGHRRPRFAARSASRTIRPTTSCAWRKGMPRRTR